VEPVDVLTGGDEQLSGVTGGNSEQRCGARRCGIDEELELLVETVDLAVQGFDSLGE
jgi:hypothetical protein